MAGKRGNEKENEANRWNGPRRGSTINDFLIGSCRVLAFCGTESMKTSFAWLRGGIGIVGILCGVLGRRAVWPGMDRGASGQIRENAKPGRANATPPAIGQPDSPSATLPPEPRGKIEAFLEC
jgi:hypothetical protein